MNARFWSSFALLLAFGVQGLHAQSFPTGDVFRPLIADPTEPRFFISVLDLHAGDPSYTVASVGAGTNFGLYRWPGERPGEGWQLGVDALVASQFNLDTGSDDLINTDFRIGLPLSYKRGSFAGRAKLFHQSSHLGDEIILSGNAPERVNLSIEALDFVLAWEGASWRVYGGGFYLLSSDIEDQKESGLHAGFDYAGTAPVLFGARLVGGIDLRSFEENDWRVGTSVKVGLQFGRPRPERRGVTVLLEGYNGPAPWGQFYNTYIKSYGVALQFDH